MNRTLNSVLALVLLVIVVVSFWKMVSEESLYYLPEISGWLVTFILAVMAFFALLLRRPTGRLERFARRVVDWL